MFAVRLLIHSKGRELGDLVYMTKLHVSGARKLLCGAAVDKEHSVVDYMHVIVHLVLYPHTANTTVCANMQYLYTVCVCIPSYTGGTK